ncbi:MAG: glycoside hydrolase family 13 protein [Leeuwenhoekiella sp.]
MNNFVLSKVEPPFWWAGMKITQLQLMFYGADISAFSISSANLEILDITKTENPNYLFVTIKTENLEAGEYEFQFKNQDEIIFTSNYVFKQRVENSHLRKGFDSSDTMYLLMPDRFANGDPSNDSQPDLTEKANRSNLSGRHGGDIKGIIDHLDYLEDLGVTALWCTPLCENNQTENSYHGYAQTDVYTIDQRFGSNEDYCKLSNELHKRDMKLIHDYVTNHWGSQHWMIKDLPAYDWIHQFPGYSNTNHRMTTQYDPHTSQIDKKNCEDGWFVKSMPDLNQSNPLVLNYLIQNAIWWVEFANLDGIRVDTFSYNEKNGIAVWTKAIIDEYPNLNIVGEVWLHRSAQISYWQKDSPIGAIQNYNSHLPTVMDFTLHDTMGGMFYEEGSWGGISRAYENMVNDFLYANPQNILVFAENHDSARINQVFQGDFNKYKLAMTLILTTRGIPQIYYGSEIGMQGEKSKGDGDIRHDFPGGWPDDNQNAFVKEGRSEYQEKYHAFTKKLLNWRKNITAVHKGKLLHYIPENNIYIYFRILDDQRIMIVLNNNPSEQNIELDRFVEGLGHFTKGKELFEETEIVFQKSLKIPGKSAFIIDLLG